MQNPAKLALRKQINSLLKGITSESRRRQSESIAQKIFNLLSYQKAKRVSIYLSTDFEVNTIGILKKMFDDEKEVFVPTYAGKEMMMVKLFDFDDYEKLPLTKWNIKQPNAKDTHRENPMLTSDPLDLILMPGVAFTVDGGRLGHGMGYYDKYLHNYFNKFPDRAGNSKTLLVALAFQEQIVEVDQLPIEPLDYPLDLVLTAA